MGISPSRPFRPQRPQIRVLLPSKPRPTDAAALRDRISLNKATLKATLLALGHPLPPSHRDSTATCRQPCSPRATRTRSRVEEGEGGKAPPPVVEVPESTDMEVGQGHGQGRSHLRRESREVHWAQALRMLESGVEAPQVLASRLRRGKKSRVPSIILRRVERSG